MSRSKSFACCKRFRDRWGNCFDVKQAKRCKTALEQLESQENASKRNVRVIDSSDVCVVLVSYEMAAEGRGGDIIKAQMGCSGLFKG